VHAWLSVVPRSGKAPLFAVYELGPVAGARSSPVSSTTLVVRDAAGQWTADFSRLRTTMGMPTRVD
jgi:hypothetical protein